VILALDHAAANNRIALLDGTNTNVKATITSAITAVLQTNSKFSAMFGPWIVVPGVTPGTTRTLPPSSMVAGMMAKTDAAAGSSNTPAAGDRGIPKYVTKLAADPFTDLDRADLNANYGFSAIITKYGKPRIYGWRTLASLVTDPNWTNLGNARLVMDIAAEADAIGEIFLFDEIDGQGRTIGKFNGALVGMLMPYWALGSLYGISPEQAFVVDTGPSVNTPTTIAAGQLKATIAIRPSPYGEEITIEVVKQRIDQSL
jgi:phage tail sheath protein FI